MQPQIHRIPLRWRLAWDGGSLVDYVTTFLAIIFIREK